MLSEQDIELAHPEAFDFAFGNLPAAKRAEFNRHLSGCRYCQSVINEYGEIGGIIKSLPPHVEPPADLEDRTVAKMVTALAEQRAKLDHQSPADQPVPAEPQRRPVVTRLPAWRRRRGRLAAVAAAAAAAVIAAIVVPLSLTGGGGEGTPTQATAVIPLHVTQAAKLRGYGAATGRATARHDASGSWKVSLTVQHLKSFGDNQWYTCWYKNQKGRLASAGTFQVRDGGSWTFPMTSAADPHDFRTMEITLGAPSNTGSLDGLVVLSGHPQ